MAAYLAHRAQFDFVCAVCQATQKCYIISAQAFDEAWRAEDCGQWGRQFLVRLDYWSIGGQPAQIGPDAKGPDALQMALF